MVFHGSIWYFNLLVMPTCMDTNMGEQQGGCYYKEGGCKT